MIKAIIFDAGGVIVEHGNQIDEFAKIFKSKSKEKLWEKINNFVGPLCSGEISEKEYWKRVAESENIDPKLIPEDLWVKGYKETTKINEEVMQLIKDLRNNYITILVSNTLTPHATINRERGLFDVFDDVLNSNKVHLSKDGSEIFELALKRNKLDAKECIFIDDIQKFLDVANSIGIQGILFEDVNQLKKELINLGVKVN